jgi:hypothetical protein
MIFSSKWMFRGIVESPKGVAQGMTKGPWISLESKEHDFLEHNYIERKEMQLHFL